MTAPDEQKFEGPPVDSQADPYLGWGSPEDRWAKGAPGATDEMVIHVRYQKARWFKGLVPPPRKSGKPWPEFYWSCWIEGSRTGFSEESAAEAVRMALACHEAEKARKARGPQKFHQFDELVQYMAQCFKDPLTPDQIKHLEDRWERRDADWFVRVDQEEA